MAQRQTPVPARPTVFLHVGTHKTGTTSFQRLMRQRAGQFRRAGVAVRLEPRAGATAPGATVGNSIALANAVLRRELLTIARLSGRHPVPGPVARFRLIRRFRREVAALLDPPGIDALLVSAEGLCFARKPAEARRLRRIFDPRLVRLVPILVLRNRTDWEASWRAQLARTPGAPGRLARAPARRRVDAPWYYDTDAIAGFWRALGPLEVIDYDRAMATDGSIIPALLRVMGLEGRVEAKQIFVNRRKTPAPGSVDPPSRSPSAGDPARRSGP